MDQRTDTALLGQAQALWPVDQIRVGERHRRDLGDLAGLAQSIASIGLLHPVVITPDGRLIAGERRLRAVEMLGWTCVPVRVVDIDAVVRGELAENAHRKDFTPSEAVAIAKAVEPLEREAARERMLAGRPSAKLAEGRKGEAREQVAAFVGIGRTTLAKATEIVEAAESNPERFGALVEAMDKSGRVDGPYTRLRNMKQTDAILREPPPLPMLGPYRSGIIDPPFASEPFAERDQSRQGRGYYPYPTMTIPQIAAMPVPSILHENATVWLWVTNFILMDGLHLPIAHAWGLRPVAIFTWVKRRWGNGQRARGQTEHLVQLIRGNVACLGGDTSTVIEGEADAHSEKPVEAYELIEKLTPAPRFFELFCRAGPRENWDQHGDQIGKLAPPTRP
jgi:ParB family chromosome partitioning protein